MPVRRAGTVLTPTARASSPGTLADGLAQLSFVVQATLARVGATYGLSPSLVRLLGILRDRTPTINDLAAYLELDKSSVTGLVDRAEDRGLVARSSAPQDRRCVHVVLSPDGRALVREATAAFEAELALLTGTLSATRRDELLVAATRLVDEDARRRPAQTPATRPWATRPSSSSATRRSPSTRRATRPRR